MLSDPQQRAVYNRQRQVCTQAWRARADSASGMKRPQHSAASVGTAGGSSSPMHRRHVGGIILAVLVAITSVCIKPEYGQQCVHHLAAFLSAQLTVMASSCRPKQATPAAAAAPLPPGVSSMLSMTWKAWRTSMKPSKRQLQQGSGAGMSSQGLGRAAGGPIGRNARRSRHSSRHSIRLSSSQVVSSSRTRGGGGNIINSSSSNSSKLGSTPSSGRHATNSSSDSNISGTSSSSLQ